MHCCTQRSNIWSSDPLCDLWLTDLIDWYNKYVPGNCSHMNATKELRIIQTEKWILKSMHKIGWQENRINHTLQWHHMSLMMPQITRNSPCGFPILDYVLHVVHISCIITNCDQHQWVIPSPLSIGGGWGCEVSCGGHHRPRGKTTTGSALDGAVFDIAQILAYLVHNMSRSQLYLGFGHFGWLLSITFWRAYG